ncbi:MAG: HAD family hydrolase [Clostridia bacterium]|nr:HAD family hydrolase [Clostridia bacterium]
MNKKTLYVTDLDGTLLTNDKKITHFSRRTLDALIERGALITYATARSYVSARQIIGDFEPKIPVIIYNGTFILDLKTGEKLLIDSFSSEDVCEIKALLEKNDIYPFVYATVDGEERFSYVKGHTSLGQEHFLSEHKGDKRENPVEHNRLYLGEVFHFTIMGDEALLKELCSALEIKYECVCYKEQYSGDWWLEIHPKGASKASAIKKLKALLGAHRVVCFGDGKNDASMFEACDECYAVENADEPLKKIATGIIPSNEDDGVARWLLEHIKL